MSENASTLLSILMSDNSTPSANTTGSNTTATPIILSSIDGSNKTETGKSTINCAKECPCGVTTIPVPDQWLEVMVSGGFKVWHIIFIIIALIVTMVVVYCCFHRCRIPRTKQEIEADLMRSNMTNKFRDYLQELPNEPVTFVEVLKRVQDMEEKLEKDNAQVSRDAGMRKRMGWLNLKGKNTPPQNAADIEAGGGQGAEGDETVTPSDQKPEVSPVKEDKLEKDAKDAKDAKKVVDLLKDRKEDAANLQTITKLDNLPPEAPAKASLNVDSAAKLAKEQQHKKGKHHELRNKRSLQISPDTQQKPDMSTAKLEPIRPGLDSVSQQPDGDDKHIVRRRKHKPNLSRSKVVREKTHPSFDAINNGFITTHSSNEKLNLIAAHEQTQVTFEDTTTPKSLKKKDKTSVKKKAEKKHSKPVLVEETRNKPPSPARVKKVKQTKEKKNL